MVSAAQRLSGSLLCSFLVFPELVSKSQTGPLEIVSPSAVHSFP